MRLQEPLACISLLSGSAFWYAELKVDGRCGSRAAVAAMSDDRQLVPGQRPFNPPRSCRAALQLGRQQLCESLHCGDASGNPPPPDHSRADEAARCDRGRAQCETRLGPAPSAPFDKPSGLPRLGRLRGLPEGKLSAGKRSRVVRLPGLRLVPRVEPRAGHRGCAVSLLASDVGDKSNGRARGV